MSKGTRVCQLVLTVLGVVCTLIAVSVWFVPKDERFDHDANALISTFGAGLGLFVIICANVGLSRGDRSAWLALWVLPAFFASHVVLLGTWVPDGVFLVVSAACLLGCRPRAAADAPLGGVAVWRRDATSTA